MTEPTAGTAFNPDHDVTIAYELWAGGSVPLVLVNGLGSPMVSYEPGFIDALRSRGFSVVRFDNRDVGRSSRVPDAEYTLSNMAADVVAVMNAVGWETAHVLGMSMGGMIVQTLAIEQPDRVRSITSLMSNTGNPKYGSPKGEAQAALVAVPPTDRDGWIAHRLASEKIWGSHVIDDPTWARRKAEMLFDYGMDTAGTGRQYRAVGRSGSREAALPQVSVSTLVLHGSVDTLLDPSGGRRTAELIPNARYVEIEGMGHDLPPNFWERLADEVAGFVQEHTDDLH